MHDRSEGRRQRGSELASDDRERFQEIRALEYITLGQLQASQSPEGALALARDRRPSSLAACRWRSARGVIYGLAAQALDAAGDRAGARAAAAWHRAAAEIDAKTGRLRDPTLRSAFLASRTALAVRHALGR